MHNGNIQNDDQKLAGTSESTVQRTQEPNGERKTEEKEKRKKCIRDTNETEWQYFTRSHSYRSIKTT